MQREYGNLEITDPQRRAMAKQAMLLLWDAMDLTTNPYHYCSEEAAEKQKAWQSLYDHVGTVLLGPDIPERLRET